MDYLKSLSKTVTATPPEGSFSVDDAAKATGMVASSLRIRLNKDVQAGKLESSVFKVGAHYTRYFWEPKDVKVRKR